MHGYFGRLHAHTHAHIHDIIVVQRLDHRVCSDIIGTYSRSSGQDSY